MKRETRSSRKVAGTQRTMTAEETLARALGVGRRLGVTRLADITGLDRIGLPIYSSIVPESRDGISVYNGKGLRPIEAKVGALMEAIERQTALKARLPLVEASFEQLQRERRVLDPKTLNERLRADYSETSIYSWVSGWDLASGMEVMVPATFAGYGWDDLPHGSCFEFSSTNGLSAGNCWQEAACQGLCELIERDAWTLAEVGAHILPWARAELVNPSSAASALDDFEVCPCIDLEHDPALEMFRSSGLYPVVHDITSDIGVPTVFVAVADEMIPEFPMVHWGVGTHPDAEVAARRALTEAAQSRCVDIQAVREDIQPAGVDPVGGHSHTRRAGDVNRRFWHLGESRTRRRLSELPSVVHDDVQADLDHLLARLRARGLTQVVVVEFTPPDAVFAVVRVIVPGLETWSLRHGPLGPRAMEFWRTHA